MTLEEGKRYIEQARAFPILEWISFTGGEPFLLGGQLVELVAYAAKRGLKTECVTNGFWARSEQEARQRLRPLRAAGLEVLNLSADAFHQEFIPLVRVLNGIKAALYLGIKVVLMVVTAKSHTPEGLLCALEDEQICILRPTDKPPAITGRSVLWVESGFLPVGRAKMLPQSEWILDPQASFKGGCPFVLRDLSILPGGDVRACCSAGALTRPLELGNVNHDGVASLIDGAMNRPLISILVREGPQGLLRRFTRDNQIEQGAYVSKCHLCFELLSAPTMQGMGLVKD